MKPNLKAFMYAMDDQFTGNPNAVTIHVLENFYDFYEEFVTGIINRTIIINTSTKVKKSIFQKYTQLLIEELTKNSHKGFVPICTGYCTGAIELHSKLGTAHAPVLPSACLNGKVEYARSKIV